jgi:hypothetical protein
MTLRPPKRMQSAFIYCLLAYTPALFGQTNVLTWHNDNARTGQNLQETALTLTNVNSSTFGKLFTVSVDGKVDAQPLYVESVAIPGLGPRNVLYVVTENDSAYAFDADNGTPYWHTSLLGTSETPSDDHGCSQVTPTIGATATPAIDTSKGALYTLAMTKDASGNYHHRLHALNLATGAELFSGPKEVQATYPGTGAGSSGGTVTFNPGPYKSRPGLLILNGVVYTSWGSHCDAPPYTGWVIGYNESTLAQVSVLDLTPNGSDGGIWMSGAGPAADANGNIYLLTGNGTFDTTLSQGFPSSHDYGNAFVKISTSGGSLAVADYFTMDNTSSESSSDTDFGSGGMLLLPPLTGQGGTSVSLAVGAGKDGNIYVVNQANLGKFSSSADNIYQQMSGAAPGGVWASPAWFNGHLYYGAVGDYVKAFAFTNGLLDTVASSHSPTKFGYPGATPSISANGTSNGIVWAAENTSPAVLHAYDASNLATELYNSNQAANGRDQFGSGNKYIVPTVVNGKVYVGTTSGVGVFGLLLPSVVSVSPSSGTGLAQTFTAVYSDSNGTSDLSAVSLIFNTSLKTSGACAVFYVPGTNQLYLYNDAGTELSAGVTPGSAAQASNSQCTLAGTGSSFSTSGNNLTLKVALTFAGSFVGQKDIFLYADGKTSSGAWVKEGTWTPSSAGSPAVVSLSPASGTGPTQTFTAVYSDPNGISDLNAVIVLFNTSVNVTNACAVIYVPGTNQVYLYNDAGTAFSTGVTPGSAAQASNSQCTLTGAGSSFSTSGNNLTLKIALNFSGSFAGEKYTLLYAAGAASSGWVEKGTWTP